MPNPRCGGLLLLILLPIAATGQTSKVSLLITQSALVTDTAPVPVQFNLGSVPLYGPVQNGTVAVRWRGALLPVSPASTFIIPAHLRQPGLVEYQLWSTAEQSTLPYVGYVQLLFPPADVAEADPAKGIVSSFGLSAGAGSSGDLRVHALSTGALVRTFPVEASAAVAIEADAAHAWIASPDGTLRRRNLFTGDVVNTVSLGGGSPPYWVAIEPWRSHPRAIIVAYGSLGSSFSAEARVYRDGIPLPGTGPRMRVVGVDSSQRAIFQNNQVCDIDPDRGFGACSGLTGLPVSCRYAWGTRCLSLRSVVDTYTGKTLIDYVDGATVVDSGARVLISDASQLDLVDPATLGPIAAIPGSTHQLRGPMHTVAPDWLVLPTQSGLLVARLPQVGPGPSVSPGGVVHGATGKAGPVAPGMIVTLFGRGLGPEAGAGPVLETKVRLATEVEHTRVLFDGAPAPVLYTGPGQINAVIPGNLRASGQILVQVYRYDIPAARLFVDAAAFNPGLFGYAAAGRSYAAAVDDSGRLQGPGAPLTRGRVATFYATGLGLPAPLDADSLPVRPAALPVAPSISIGGRAARVLYAGAAPGLSAGVTQLNVIVPSDAPAGDAVEVSVTAGSVTQGGMWAAIR